MGEKEGKDAQLLKTNILLWDKQKWLESLPPAFFLEAK